MILGGFILSLKYIRQIRSRSNSGDPVGLLCRFSAVFPQCLLLHLEGGTQRKHLQLPFFKTFIGDQRTAVFHHCHCRDDTAGHGQQQTNKAGNKGGFFPFFQTVYQHGFILYILLLQK